MGCSKKKKLLVCVEGKSCPRSGSKDIFKRLKKAVAGCELDDYFKIKKAECFGLCKYSPVIKVVPEGVLYGRVDTEDVIKIALRHAKKTKPLKKLLVGKQKRKA